MPLLYYWRSDNYYRDLDFGAGYHLNQANPLLHEVEPGESLWAFTRRKDGRYVLAAELVVAAKTLNPKGFRYGPYRIWGDLRRSRYFATDAQPDITLLVRSLSVRAGGDVLGRAFQGRAAVRPLSQADHQLLARYAAKIPSEPRARLLPEERLEALLLAGDESAVSALIREESPGYAEERKRYLRTTVARRNRELVGQLREMYEGMCQLCLWSPRQDYQAELCEGHHIRWLSQGGEDSPTNMVLICPNHHRAIHLTEARFDWSLNAFKFKQRIEPLVVLRHGLHP